MHGFRGGASDAVELLNGQRIQKRRGVLRTDHSQTVGFAEVGCRLRKEFVEGNARRGGKPARHPTDFLLDFPCNRAGVRDVFL
ncbi:MAG: hypothetical protein PUK77_08595, partial [bacterium]|nr:hypothetical protein [bacterium]